MSRGSVWRCSSQTAIFSFCSNICVDREDIHTNHVWAFIVSRILSNIAMLWCWLADSENLGNYDSEIAKTQRLITVPDAWYNLRRCRKLTIPSLRNIENILWQLGVPRWCLLIWFVVSLESLCWPVFGFKNRTHCLCPALAFLSHNIYLFLFLFTPYHVTRHPQWCKYSMGYTENCYIYFVYDLCRRQ